MTTPPTLSPIEIRRIILSQSYRAHVGHIGSELSVVEILAALYGGAMHIPSPEDPDRDRLVLSKGHAALALYACLALRGWIPMEQLNTFTGDDTLLGVHPEKALRGVDFCSGSLGHGLSIGAGAALAARLQGSKRRVFVLVSDAECNEGSLWEGVMFAAQHKLSNLVVLVDLNGQQAFGYTRDVLDLSPLAARWQAFGWHAQEVPGHDPAAIQAAIQSCSSPAPHVIIARTTFGKGVSFMENLIKWHYWPLSEAEYQQAMAEIEAAA
ncbi:MAG TPA: transketolase [Anaerolineaceae bacterium]|nr:transketolase [Anaerolineaceae bacterium]HPN51533.1 transketolase [Anaerolineaceae bacterium]